MNVRIDDRLIHGQVVGYWIPQFNVERILIVDDEIANDEQRKMALKFGTPGKTKLSVFGVEKTANKLKKNIDKGINVMIMAKGPIALANLVAKGYKIDEITVGNMSTKEKSKQIRKTVFVDTDEKKAFQFLRSKGVKIYSQMVPNESKEDITNLFK